MDKCKLDIEKDIRTSYKRVLEKEVGQYIVKNENALYSIELNYKGSSNKQSVKRKVYLANQKAGVNYGIYNNGNKIEIDIPLSDIDKAYDDYLEKNPEINTNNSNTFFQLPTSAIRKEAIKELDSYLLKFLEPFHFQSKEIDDMKKRFGVDSLGAVDLLHKMIYYVRESERNEETIPEEVGHAIVMLAGKDHPIIKELLKTITNWPEFDEVNKQYFKIYNNIEKVKVEAVGKLIAKALVKNYKNTDQKQKSLLQKLFDLFKKLFIKSNSSFMLADKIAVEILKGNTDYIANLKPKEEKLNYDEALKGNDLAQSIIKDFTETSKNYLVGSLAIAGQGDAIYRSNSEPIHDLDFIQDGSDIENNKIINDILNKRGAVPIHYGWTNENKQYTTYSYYVPAEGYRIEATDRDRRKADNTGGWITEFNLLDNSTNEIVFNARSFWEKLPNGKFTKQLYFNGKSSEDASKLFMPVDFFVYPNGFSELTKGIFSSSANIYLGKLSLSPLGENEVMFDRPKDQQDYVLHNPINRESISNNAMSYYQVNDIKPGVDELFSSNPELANQVYEALGFINTSEIVLEKPRLNPDNFEATSYPIKINGKSAGVVSVDDKGYISSSIGMAGVELDKDFQGKGYGTKVYLALAKELAKKGKTLKSEAFGKSNINDAANRVWTSLLNKGLAKDKGSYYELDLTQQEQQAKQLYSQYLDSIFPDSKVKDIVYHGTDKEFDKFLKEFIGKKTGWAKDLLGFYFFSTPQSADTYTIDKENGHISARFEHESEGYDLQDMVDMYPEIYKEFRKENPNADKYEFIDFGIGYLRDRIIKGKVKRVLLNSKTPAFFDAKGARLVQRIDKIKELIKEGETDGIIVKNTLDQLNDSIGFEDDTYIVFEPEQIHILGSKQDIEGFKEFVDTTPNTNNNSTGMQLSNNELQALNNNEELQLKIKCK